MNGSEQTAQRAPKPEKPFTKQDFDQSLALVNHPVALALQEISGEPDRFKWQSAAAKLGPAANALKVIGAQKKEAGNQATILAGVPHIEKAQTTLQVLGDIVAEPKIWIDAFAQAMTAVDETLSALGAVTAKQLAPAKAAVEKGKQALEAFKGDLDKSIAGAKVELETALTKVAAAARPYFEEEEPQP